MPQRPVKIYIFLGVILSLSLLLILGWVVQTMVVKRNPKPIPNNTFAVPIVIDGTPTPTIIPGM